MFDTRLFWQTIVQWTLLSILVYIVISIWQWLYFKWNNLKTFQRQRIPGPKPSFWWGNLPEYLQCPYQTLDRWCHEYGSHFGYYHADKPVLVINDPMVANDILVKYSKYFPNRQKSVMNVQPFSSSLLNQRDKEWRKARRTLTPPFAAHKLAMQSTKKAINQSVGRMLKSIERKLSVNYDQHNDNHNHSGDLNEINMTPHMAAVALDVICRLAFNMPDTDVHEEHSELRRLATEFMEDNFNGATQYAEYFPFIVNLIKILYFYVGGGKFLDTILGCLRKTINEYNENMKNANINDTKNNNKKMNILDFMLEQQTKGNLDQMQIIGNALVILLAGFETTATSLTFTFYLLAKHQDIQNQLREEIQNTFVSSIDADDDGEHLENYCQYDENRLELLDRVWYEALRLYPPVVSFITRELESDAVELILENLHGIKIIQGMSISIPIWTIQHDSKYWNDPYKYDPFRDDLPIPGMMKSNYAFMPFGHGPRSCIGENVARSEARAVIAAILRHYRLDLVSEDSPRSQTIDNETGLITLSCPTVVIHPSKPLYVRLTPFVEKN